MTSFKERRRWRSRKRRRPNDIMRSRIYRWSDIYEIGRGLGIVNPQGTLQKAQRNGSAKRHRLGRYSFKFKLPPSWQKRRARKARR
jgi:hypothetical protein